MLGYVTVNQPELKIREFEEYRAYYCGLCRVLREKHSQVGRLTLNYDMVFLYMLLSSLYEPVQKERRCRCIPHPTRKHKEIMNPFAEYCGDMNVLLAYYDLLDDWQDEKKAWGRLGALALKKDCAQIRKRFPRQARAVQECVKKLRACERKGDAEIDEAAGISGRMLGEILVWKEDEWSETLRSMGFYLGKFIYLCDAYEDYEADLKNGRYNPWKGRFGKPGFEEDCRLILQNIMGECARYFERLPILQNAEILRNILYAGVWSRYELAGKKRIRSRKEPKK